MEAAAALEALISWTNTSETYSTLVIVAWWSTDTGEA